MKKEYSDFTENDFITDPFFQQWVKFPDAINNAFWEQWLAANPGMRSDVYKAKAFIENLHFNTNLPSTQQIENSLAQTLQRINVLGAVSLKPRNRVKYAWWAAAAVILFFLILTPRFFRAQKPLTIEIVAGPKEIKTILLPDSSVVTLNAGSHLTYASNLQNSSPREVWLEGEAFFDVKHIETNKLVKGFVLHLGEMNIEVVGTTFNVKRLGAVTNVSLNTGKIKIALKDDPETAIFLQPGDFISYSPKEKHILKKKVKAELYSVWKDEKIALDQMPLSEIARLLEDAYGYIIRIPNKRLADSKVSGTLYMKDENTLLQTLAFALDIDIIKKDSILIFELKK